MSAKPFDTTTSQDVSQDSQPDGRSVDREPAKLECSASSVGSSGLDWTDSCLSSEERANIEKNIRFFRGPSDDPVKSNAAVRAFINLMASYGRAEEAVGDMKLLFGEMGFASVKAKRRLQAGGRKRRSREDLAYEMRWGTQRTKQWGKNDWLPVYRAAIPDYRNLEPLERTRQEDNLREAVRKRKKRADEKASTT